METKLDGITASDFLAALDLDDIQPDDPQALSVRQLMELMQVGTPKTAKTKADAAVKAGKMTSFQTRRDGRVLTVYKVA